MSNYIKNELNIIDTNGEYKAQMQISSNGKRTKWLSFDRETAKIFIEWLTENYINVDSDQINPIQQKNTLYTNLNLDNGLPQELTYKQIENLEKLIKNYLAGKTIRCDYNDRRYNSLQRYKTFSNNFEKIDNFLGLAYTSSSCFAALWINSATLYLTGYETGDYKLDPGDYVTIDGFTMVNSLLIASCAIYDNEGNEKGSPLVIL